MGKIKLTKIEILGTFTVAAMPEFSEHKDTLFAYALNVNINVLSPAYSLIVKARPSIEALQPYIDKYVADNKVTAAQIQTADLRDSLNKGDDKEAVEIMDAFTTSSEAYDKFMQTIEEFDVIKVPIENFPKKLTMEMLKAMGWMVEMPEAVQTPPVPMALKKVVDEQV